MSWERVQVGKRQADAGRAGRVDAAIRKLGRRPYLHLLIGSAVLRAIGRKVGDRVVVQVGHGEHAGRLRLSVDGGEGHTIQPTHFVSDPACGRVAVHAATGLVAEARALANCQHEISGLDRTIVVRLPPSFFPTTIRYEDDPRAVRESGGRETGGPRSAGVNRGGR